MAWVAMDRAVRTIQEFGLEGPLERWIAVRRRIHDEVCRSAFDQDLGSFVQSYGSKQLDASLLFSSARWISGTDGPPGQGHSRGNRASPDARRACSTLRNEERG